MPYRRSTPIAVYWAMDFSPSRNPSRPSVLFAALLPPGVATAELDAPGNPVLLLAAERADLGAATPGREREFAAGRLCARSAAARLGANEPIGTRADRRAHWPRLLTGSITHTDGFAAAAVGERTRFRAIGIDAQKLGRLSRELWCSVLTPAEAQRVEGLPRALQARVATLLFSAKEAFYKCQYEVTQQWLEFAEVTVDVVGPVAGGGRFTVTPDDRAGRPGLGIVPPIGRYMYARGMVLTAMALGAR